jgi:molecular chaperone DnaK
MAHIIGIDFGTTYSCIAHLEGGVPQVIPNLDGLPTTPSVVSFTESDDRLIGNLALRQAVTNPKNTISAIKRLMGKKFSAEDVEEIKKKMPYSLVEAENGDIVISVESKMISPQEISSMILSYLKECAESFFGEEVTEAVITVPANFNDHQRKATKDAAKIAGLKVARMINEPTAASLAYGYATEKNATVAVYDLGGGTFDISLLEINDGVFHVLATSGNSYLGGEDFDNRIVEWILEEFKEETQIDLSQDKLALQRIKEAAEKAKRALSFSEENDIHIPFIYSDESGAKHLIKTLTRPTLEKLTNDLVLKTLPYIEETLEEGKLMPENIDDVILVGGQTRMPLIKHMISDFFGKKPVENINPDEIVAMGAAVQSGILKGKTKEALVLLDVTPLSLGIETEEDTFFKLIEKNTTIPTKRTKAFTTVYHNQQRVQVHVLQGESQKASENTSLAKFDLVGIEPSPAGVPQINVSFEIDASGIAKVSAKDLDSGRVRRIEINPSSGLSEDEIDKIMGKETKEDSNK